MSDSAKQRVQAISNQLSPPESGNGIPPIIKVAPDSNSQRAAGKVVIVTGTELFFSSITGSLARPPPEHPQLITNCKGANSILGIGRASAHQFAQNGAEAVYLCDYDDSNLEAHKNEINASWPNVKVHTRQFDAADEKAVQEVVTDALTRYGRLDVFFANAGTIGPMSAFTEINAGDFMETLRVNTLRLPPSLDLFSQNCAPD